MKETIDIFCEDVISRNILRAFLSPYRKHYKLSSCSLEAEEYLKLLQMKLEPITGSIIILGGDKNTTKYTDSLKKTEANNVIFLPSSHRPEKMFYLFLYNLQDDDSFWDNSLGGFDKMKCFLEYPTLGDNSNTDMYKKWFKSVSPYFGSGYKSLLNHWIVANKDEYENFISKFKEAYNIVATARKSETIS